MKKIAVITGTRAEYGLLKNIINEINLSKKLELKLIVTGTHLNKKYGYTVKEIEKDGFLDYYKVNISVDINDKKRISKEVSIAIEKFADLFLEINPDLLLILGDRYEVFAAATTAMTMNIPIAHIAGGEITEGAIDEQIRHAITKMAHIHFPGANPYEQNILNMGEEEWRVFNVGDSGIENIKLTNLLNQNELEKELNIKVDTNTILVTYHPVTLEINKTREQIDNLLKAISNFKNKKFIITYPNSDEGSQIIIDTIEKYSNSNENIIITKSLGSLRYLSLMNLCGAIIGNSSSALIEAPYLKKPVVNIGSRQQGRLKAINIIDTSNEIESIIEGINLAISAKFSDEIKNMKSLYGEGNTSKDIRNILETLDYDEKLMKKKLIWRS